MSRYTLFYFQDAGLAEPIRFLLHYCGIPFEDKRIDYQKEWVPYYRKQMPMERLPILQVNGRKLHHHLSICRYIARKNDLHGSTEEEASQIDAYAENINDIRREVVRWYIEADLQLKNKMRQSALREVISYLDRFENVVATNGGFFVGKRISWTDIYFAATIEMMSKILHNDLIYDYPCLRKLATSVYSHMMIYPYIQRRPKTDF